MNFYLSAVDAQLRHPDDLPTIGIILCKGRNEVIVEYALRDSSKPIGVAQYRLSSMLPPQLQQALPTIEDLSREFPLMAVAKLRIEIESALRRLASAHGAVDLPVGVASLLKTLQGLAVIIPGTEQFLDALAIMNQAAHGIDLDPDKAADAMEIGSVFLKTIHTLVTN